MFTKCHMIGFNVCQQSIKFKSQNIFHLTKKYLAVNLSHVTQSYKIDSILIKSHYSTISPWKSKGEKKGLSQKTTYHSRIKVGRVGPHMWKRVGREKRICLQKTTTERDILVKTWNDDPYQRYSTSGNIIQKWWRMATPHKEMMKTFYQ